MLKQRTLRLLAERSLPLRSEKLSAGSSNDALALRNQIWYTSEAIVLDAIYFSARLALLWGIALRAAPGVAFRMTALVMLFFVAIGFEQPSSLVVADSYKPAVEVANSLQVASQITASETPVFKWPVPKSYITTHFSFYHQGIDIPTVYGTTVKPTDEGKVVSAGWNGGFGNIVVIAHKNGFVSKYAHLSGVRVAAGQIVNRETTIGWVGTTGIATGAHLHFEVHKDNGPANPLHLLP